MKYFSMLILLLLTSCQNHVQHKLFSLPSDSDVNEIVKAIIESEKAPILEGNKEKIIIPFCIELRKINLVVENENELPPRMPWNSISFQELTGPKDLPDSLFHFRKSDSSYIKFQAEKYTKFTVNQDLLKSVKYTDDCNHKKGIYYDLTIPILSENKKKAYCQLTIKCSGLCGSGYEVYLEKVKSKWIVVRCENDWVS